MFRATTPKITMEIDGGIDLNDATHIYVTICDSKNTTLLEKSDSDVTIESEDRISIVLTQAEALALPVGTANIQVNYMYEYDNDTRRAATERAEISIYRNNKEVVIS